MIDEINRNYFDIKQIVTKNFSGHTKNHNALRIIDPFVCLLWENVYSASLPIFKQGCWRGGGGVELDEFLNILDIKLLSVFFQRRHTDGQQAHEKMFNITNY